MTPYNIALPCPHCARNIFAIDHRQALAVDRRCPGCHGRLVIEYFQDQEARIYKAPPQRLTNP